MMRVAMLTPWNHPCGIADYSRQLVGALRELVDVRVVELVPRYRRGLVEALRHRAPDLHYYRALGEQLNDADVAHIQFQYPLFGGFAPWKLKFNALMERVRVPVVMTMHELEAPSYRSLNVVQRQLYFHAASVVTWPQIQALIVHTKQFVEPLRDLMVAPERIHFQPMPVPALPSLPTPEAAKAKLGLSGRRVLTIIGFVVQRKGYEAALALLPDWPDDVTLAIVGGPNEFDRTGYFARIRAQHAPPRVIVTGFVEEDELHTWLAATDIVLAPFQAMSGSSSLALALAAGKPIVGTALPGLLEMNEVAPCLAAGDFATELHRVLTDDAAREQLSAGAAAYRERASQSATARATTALYEAVADSIDRDSPA